MRRAGTSARARTRRGIDFDLELAKKQSNENPVYYVQYAHARAASILRHGDRGGARRRRCPRAASCSMHPAEQALVRHLLDFPDAVATAAERRETHEVPRYAYELASAFTPFYRDCKVLTEDAQLSAARLALVDATRSVLANALGPAGDLGAGRRCRALSRRRRLLVWSSELLGRGVGDQRSRRLAARPRAAGKPRPSTTIS